MTSLLFAMVASFLAAMGAKDQSLVADLRARLGPSNGLLFVGLASAAASATIAAWFGAYLAETMSESAATMFVAIALLVASFECAWPTSKKPLLEPTRSLGAIAIVLFARQITDASRFLVLAFAVVFPFWPLTAIGGSIGGGAAIALGWTAGDVLENRLDLRKLRIALAVVLFILALLVGMSARGIIG